MKATTKTGTTIEGTPEEIAKILRELEKGKEEKIRIPFNTPPMRVANYEQKAERDGVGLTKKALPIRQIYSPFYSLQTLKQTSVGRGSTRKYSLEVYEFIKNNYLSLSRLGVQEQLKNMLGFYIPETTIDGIYRRLWGCRTVGEAKRKEMNQKGVEPERLQKRLQKPQEYMSKRKMKFPQEIYDFIIGNVPKYGVEETLLLLKKRFNIKVSRSTIYYVLKKERQKVISPVMYKGARQPELKMMRKRKLSSSAFKWLLKSYAEHSNIELQKMIKESFGVDMSTQAIGQYGYKYNIKKSPETKKRIDEERYRKVEETIGQKKLPDHKICAECTKVFRRTEFKSEYKYYISKWCYDCCIKKLAWGRKKMWGEKQSQFVREKIKHPQVGEIKVESYDGLPSIENVNVDKIILGSIVKNVIKNRTQITFSGESYSLDINDINVWKDFVIDFMAKSNQIASYFGVPNKFVRGNNWEIKYVG